MNDTLVSETRYAYYINGKIQSEKITRILSALIGTVTNTSKSNLLEFTTNF